jgi:aminomethyltransferase
MTTLSSAVDTVLKPTPLTENHRRRGAKLVPFAGFEMPLQYGKVLDEHLAVRQAAGLFDISHMGILRIEANTPQEACDFLNAMVPNDLSKGKPGKAFYTQLLNEQGGIIDDIIVYQLPDELVALPLGGPADYFVIVNASNTDVDADWLAQYAPPTVRVVDVSAQFGLLALQGPKFDQVLAKLSRRPAQGYAPQTVLYRRCHVGWESRW